MSDTDTETMVQLSALARTLESLLFLSPHPLATAELAEANSAEEEEVEQALAELSDRYQQGGHGLVLRQVAGGYALAAIPESAEIARELLAKPRIPQLTPAQAETLAIIAYLQPVSRPDIARIRGVNTDTATVTLQERGLIEEAGRSRFGALMYRTSELFLKVFGLESRSDLPDITQWDPSPEKVGELRERLLKAGEARLGESSD